MATRLWWTAIKIQVRSSVKICQKRICYKAVGKWFSGSFSVAVIDRLRSELDLSYEQCLGCTTIVMEELLDYLLVSGEAQLNPATLKVNFYYRADFILLNCLPFFQKLQRQISSSQENMVMRFFEWHCADWLIDWWVFIDWSFDC